MTKSYSDKLKDPRWQKKRLEIFKRDKWKCKKCGDDTTTLNVHHIEYEEGEPWEIDNNLLITLCEHCHEEITIIEKLEDYNFNLVNIYKSNGWHGGGRIMFVSFNGVCSMRIYDSKNNYIIGFNLCDDIPNIIRILKKI